MFAWVQQFFKITIVLCLIVFMQAGTASLTCAQTLNDAVLSALQQHPSVEGAKASLNAAKEQRREQVSNFFPELSASAQGGRQFADNSTSRGLLPVRGEAYSYFGEGTFTLRQRLFDGMETFKRVDAAEAQRESAYFTLFDVRESLALRAVQTYINVLRAREGVDMIEEHRAKVADYLKRIQNMLDEGAAAEADYQQALDIQVILDGILADFKGQVMAAESQYLEAVGQIPDGELQKPVFPMDAMIQDVDDAIQHALNNHPSISAAEFESRAASHNIGAETASLYPDLNGELSYLKNNRRDEIGGETEDARAVLRMSWDFSTGGAQFARIRRSKYTHKETLAQLREIKRQIERDVRLAYSEYVTAGKQLELLGKRRELNEKLFETYTVQFEGARVNLLQLMQSHNQLFNTRLELMNGLYRLMSAKYAALASTGLLQRSLGMETIALNPKWEQAELIEEPVAKEPPRTELAEEIRPVESQPLLEEKPEEEQKASIQNENEQTGFLTFPNPKAGGEEENKAAAQTKPSIDSRLLTGLMLP